MSKSKSKKTRTVALDEYNFTHRDEKTGLRISAPFIDSINREALLNIDLSIKMVAGPAMKINKAGIN
ncbi:hypothetical protein JXA32_13965 [Candidatus Sumerlaeota bacterium]|nr:hypothetical protein [Candidatus Sumerlaeota bacterium]